MKEAEIKNRTFSDLEIACIRSITDLAASTNKGATAYVNVCRQ